MVKQTSENNWYFDFDIINLTSGVYNLVFRSEDLFGYEYKEITLIITVYYPKLEILQPIQETYII